jgi:carbon-monoxide dehydrogenase large subunit
LTGSSPHGQGQETTFSQIVADTLGVSMDDVVVVHGDTAKVQYGIGTFGSRATAIGGTAVYLALQDIRNKAANYAAHLIGIAAGDVRFEDGVFSSAKSEKSLTLAEVALEAHLCKNLPPSTEPGLFSTRTFEPPNFSFPFGAHVAVVEVDGETGQIEILRYVAVDDCGKVINPLMADGQIHGGIAQGLGQALLEQVVYDEEGQLVTASLMDYGIPKARHIPWIESDRTETPSPSNPLGAKGIGESGTIGATPAIVNAVVDALSPFGVRHMDMPLTPNKIWHIVSGSSNSL